MGSSCPAGRVFVKSPAGVRARPRVLPLLAGLLSGGLLLSPAAALPEGTGDALPPLPSSPSSPAPATPPSLPGPGPSAASPGAGGADRGTPAASDNTAVPLSAGAPGRRSVFPAAAPASSAAAVFQEPAILRVFECPRSAIARMLSAAVEEGEFSEALGLEREILALCRDRQALLAEIVASDRELAAALRASASARADEALRRETMRREADARVRAAHEAMLEASKAELARKEADGAEEAGTAPAPEPPPDYGWFAVTGSGAALRAAVTDGEKVWRVEGGDSLPGGVAVVAVEARPPGVRVTGWRADRLPWRSRAPR